MDLTNAMSDLKTRQSNLAGLAKELKGDKNKEAVKTQLDALLKALAPLSPIYIDLTKKIRATKDLSSKVSAFKQKVGTSATALNTSINDIDKNPSAVEAKLKQAIKNIDALDGEWTKLASGLVAADSLVTSINAFNKSLDAQRGAAKKLSDAADDLRGKNDTKTKDFSGIYSDTASLVGDNTLVPPTE